MGILHDTERESLLDEINLAFVDDYYEIPVAFTRAVLGSGATVAQSYARARARLYFLKTLHRLVPESTSMLGTDEAREAERSTSEAWSVIIPSVEATEPILEEVRLSLDNGEPFERRRELWGRIVDELGYVEESPAIQKGGKASQYLTRHVNAWQARWNLTDAWIADAAYLTLDVFEAYRADGWWFEGPLVLDFESFKATVHDGKEPAESARAPFRFTPPHKQINIPVYLDDLKHPPYETEDGYEMEDEGEFGSFDTRTETVDDAVKRLLPTLEARLRRHLERIEKDDRTLNDALKPVSFRKTTAFEWLVRYQVLGESRKKIAAADGVDYAGVNRAVNRTAELIGLTLRKETGGRPRKNTRTQNV